MPYERQIDRTRPGCLIFMLDQSLSMKMPLANPPGRRKSEAVATAINELLHTVVQACTKDVDAPPRNYYDISVIGYGGNGVGHLLGGPAAGLSLVSVDKMANATLRHNIVDGIRAPAWIDPVSIGETPMCAAFDIAGRVAAGWVQAHRDSFPPIVINITDGAATDGHPEDVEKWGERLRALHTNDGNLLLFTIHITSAMQAPIVFPSSEAELPPPKKDAQEGDFRLMFRLSSELPDFMREQVKPPVRAGARGLVCNADLNALLHALRVGTSVDHLTRS